MLEVETERARIRQLATLKQNQEANTTVVELSPQRETSENENLSRQASSLLEQETAKAYPRTQPKERNPPARDIVGDKLGISGRTVSRAVQVVDVIDSRRCWQSARIAPG